MTGDLDFSAESAFILRALSYYTHLVPDSTTEPDLGGNLLYAGELDGDGRALAVAANIAGAASLCVTANLQTQKQAIRDGIVDFLVTSLDEALRILKNEIRKRSTVAVCVAAAPSAVEAEMAERGVAPDLFASGNGQRDKSLTDDVALVSWSVATAPAHWMPKLDGFALECAANASGAARRWIRLSPRYMGRLAQSFHVALADRAFATRFFEGTSTLEGGGIPARLQVSYRGGCEEFTLPNWYPKSARVPAP